jgi:hypothetical protein
VRKFLDFLGENSWTYAGTGMVLITLTGPTLRQALWLTGVALIVHALVTLTQKD